MTPGLKFDLVPKTLNQRLFIFRYDFVYVYDGSDAFGTLVGTLTGVLPTGLTSTGTDMFITFISDDSETTPGFRIEFAAS